MVRALFPRSSSNLKITSKRLRSFPKSFLHKSNKPHDAAILHRAAHQSQEINTSADKNSFAHGFCKKAYDYDFSCLKIPDLPLKGDRVFFELQKPYLLKTMWKTSIIVNLFGQKAEIQMRGKVWFVYKNYMRGHWAIF